MKRKNAHLPHVFRLPYITQYIERHGIYKTHRKYFVTGHYSHNIIRLNLL